MSLNGYLKEENIYKSSLAVQHLGKLINLLYTDQLEKLITTSPSIDFALPMARGTIKPTNPIIKQKQGQPDNVTSKKAKKN